MSERSVANEVLALLALVNAPGENQPPEAVTVDEVQHFIEGITSAGSITFEIDPDHCAVIVALEEFNQDDALPRTATKSEKGKVVTELKATPWVIGADLFYVFSQGTGKITFVATPEGGKSYHARAVGYRLPHSCLKRLKSVGTSFPS